MYRNGFDVYQMRDFSVCDLVSNLYKRNWPLAVKTITAEQIATEQESKMRKFVSEWFNTAPDVQEGHIRRNRWPDAV
jgi:hypothetical protein